MTDIIGLEPNRKTNPALDKALKEMESMTGQEKVKQSIMSFVFAAENNYKNELKGIKVDALPLNKLFIGNPGTGNKYTNNCYIYIDYIILTLQTIIIIIVRQNYSG